MGDQVDVVTLKIVVLLLFVGLITGWLLWLFVKSPTYKYPPCECPSCPPCECDCNLRCETCRQEGRLAGILETRNVHGDHGGSPTHTCPECKSCPPCAPCTPCTPCAPCADCLYQFGGDRIPSPSTILPGFQIVKDSFRLIFEKGVLNLYNDNVSSTYPVETSGNAVSALSGNFTDRGTLDLVTGSSIVYSLSSPAQGLGRFYLLLLSTGELQVMNASNFSAVWTGHLSQVQIQPVQIQPVSTEPEVSIQPVGGGTGGKRRRGAKG